jgi:TolB-like protein
VDEDDLTSFVCNERVRFAGYVTRELSDKIRKKFNVSAILTGAIISFSTEEIPEFGILARIIDTSDGTILWADYSAATGDDFIAILELGRLKSVFSLIPKVIDMLFASFKAEELGREIKPLHRIAVMPFKNNSDFNNAGIIATYMFMIEILKGRQFMPIEYGATRDTIIKLGIRRKGDIGYENIGELSKELKARGILIGVVDNYSDGTASSRAPNVGITARLVDGGNNKILWYNSYQLSGDEHVIALDWGRIRSVHSVAYKAISALVKEMSKKKWHDRHLALPFDSKVQNPN